MVQFLPNQFMSAFVGYSLIGKTFALHVSKTGSIPVNSNWRSKEIYWFTSQ